MDRKTTILCAAALALGASRAFGDFARGRFNGWGLDCPLMQQGNFYAGTCRADSPDGDAGLKFDLDGDWGDSVWGAGTSATVDGSIGNASRSGGGNLSMDVESGCYYTFHLAGDYDWENRAYVVMKTRNEPATFLRVTDDSDSAYEGDVTVTASCSAGTATTISSEETHYIQYTTDAWATKHLVAMDGGGLMRRGTIPGQPAGTAVEYIVFSSTMPTTLFTDDVVPSSPENLDQLHFCMLAAANGGNPYRYTTTSESPAGYAAWAGENGLGGPEEVTDGQPNLVRYAFDKPAGAFSPITNIAFTAAGRPVLSLLPLNAAATGFVTVKALSTTNLADWAHAEEAIIRVNANGRIAFPTHDGDTRFYRLSATEGASPGGVQLWENGPYWAECNVGASKPEDYGYYFWWGDTVGYVRSGGTRNPLGLGYYSSVTWVSSTGERMNGSPFSPSSCSTYGKVDSELLSAGCVDSTGNLAPEHDAAQVHWGDGWRMPTDAEFAALTNNCTAAWITTNGVSGRLVTGKGAYADRSIFLPAAGYGSGANFGNPNLRGYYRSSTPDSDNSYKAWYLDFNSGLFQRDTYYGRQYGLSVRPVRDAD